MLFLLTASFPASADVVRNVVCTTPDAVEVELVWSREESPESAMLVKESLPTGWTTAFDASANPSVSAVREESGAISFVVSRTALQEQGRLIYGLRRIDSSVALPAVTGICRTSSLSGVSSTSIVQGSLTELVADTATGAEEDVPAAGTLLIESFHVSSGDHPRATFAWKGSGNRPVSIQYCPSLVDDAPTPGTVSRKSLAASAANGWTTFETYTPPVRRGGAKESSADALIEFTPDRDAPAGFYRLVIEVED